MQDKYKNQILQGDAQDLLDSMPADLVNLVITSPPYFGCRVYGNETVGREQDPREYVKSLLPFTEKIKRVLHHEGSFYLNIGDIYFGNKGFSRNKGARARKTDSHYKDYKVVKQDGKYLQYKQLLMLPERVAIGMQEQGWVLRNKIIWEKPNPIPSYSPDRRYPVYEHIFHFVKSRKYFFDLKIAKEMKNHRDVVKVGIEPFDVHPASFPLSLIVPLILSTSKVNDLVLDPFLGSGTTAVACVKTMRNYLGFEINPSYCKYAERRIKAEVKEQALNKPGKNTDNLSIRVVPVGIEGLTANTKVKDGKKKKEGAEKKFLEQSLPKFLYEEILKNNHKQAA